MYTGNLAFNWLRLESHMYLQPPLWLGFGLKSQPSTNGHTELTTLALSLKKLFKRVWNWIFLNVFHKSKVIFMVWATAFATSLIIQGIIAQYAAWGFAWPDLQSLHVSLAILCDSSNCWCDLNCWGDSRYWCFLSSCCDSSHRFISDSGVTESLLMWLKSLLMWLESLLMWLESQI